MPDHRLILVVLSALVATLVTGCDETDVERMPVVEVVDPLEIGQRYVLEPDFRRQVLVESLVDPQNGYSARRLANYGLGDRGWDALPVLNPPVRPVTTGDWGRFVDDPALDTDGLTPVFDAASFEWTHERVLELGRDAFERYPLQTDLRVGELTASAELSEAYGLWVDARGHLGGLVRVRGASAEPDDRVETFAKTCTTCHARPIEPGGTLVHGATNPNFDHGASDHRALVAAGVPAEDVAFLLDWGPGQVDVTNDGVANAVAITDLRPIRYQTRLHWAGTVENSLAALAVRIETLIITSHGARVRPPREVAFAMAYYLWSLGEPGPETEADDTHPGAAVFAAECSGCHQSDGTTIAPVPVSVVGTDGAVAGSTARGVGTASGGSGVYRVPSLWKVADRRQLLHHGRVDSLATLLSRERLDDVPGHPFGTELGAADRAALIGYLETLGR